MNTFSTLNESAEPEPYSQHDRSVRTDCLLAVRKAGASFGSSYNVCSESCEAVVRNYELLSGPIKDARDSLVQTLHEAVPKAKTSSERHQLLQIKRNVFNCTILLTEDLDVLDPEYRAQVVQYSSMLSARDALVNNNRESIFQEFRNQLNTLLSAEEFRSALNYSCPWLIDAYHRHGPGGNTDFSNEERGIYSYATRFFSKANPFHVFANVAFPAHTGLHVDCEYEMVVNSSLILALERLLLQGSTNRKRRFVYLRTYRRENKGYEFVVRNKSSLMRIAVKNSLALQAVVEYFTKVRSAYTVGDCVEYLSGALAGAEQSDVEKYLYQLIDHGIVVEYLVTNFDHFADNLLGILPEYDSAIAALQQRHLARVGKADLSQFEQQGKDSFIADLQFEGTAYYINAYSRESTANYEATANLLYPALKAIKQLFLPCNNFTEFAYVSSAYIHDQCAARQSAVPYLELLTEFLRDPASIVSRYRPSCHRSLEKEQARQTWLCHLTECEGILSDEDLAQFVSERPADEYSGNICFNGVVDPISGTFYPHNFFAGNGRYSSRYLLGMSGQRRSRVVQKEGLLDVQIVPAYDDNRFYVAPMLPAACGFDARYRHQFQHWVDPANVTVELENGHVVYHEYSSGRALRFHFFGFLLGDFLTPEYQLFLTDHADFFNNPFDRAPSFRPGMEHVAPLYYGAVCLRREQWRFQKTFFDPVWKSDDILACTISLRGLLRDAGLSFTQCYCELFDPAAHQRRPRYFEICNPLSVHVFRRAVRSSSSSTVVSIARMEPPAENFVREGQCFPMTELMIEA
jgi:hypothetical protein